MKVTISRSSWHYRMTDWVWGIFDKDPGQSLCVYFWQALLAPVIFLGLAVLCIMAVVCMSLWIFYFSGAALCDFLVLIHVLPKSFDMVPNTFNWLHVLVSVLIHGSIFGHIFYKHTRPEKDKPKEDNFVVAFVKAKKRKICPIIEYKD